MTTLLEHLRNATIEDGGRMRRLDDREISLVERVMAPYLAAYGIGRSDRPLGIGDRVRWRSSNKDKAGEIVGIVPAGSSPSREGFAMTSEGLSRNQVSYVVRGTHVDRKGVAIGKPTLFWPLTSLIERVEQAATLPTPRVAVATVVFDEQGRVLVIERMPGSATGGGDLAIPGGKLDAGESLVDGARRELFEEVGIEAHSMTKLSVLSEDNMWGPLHHYVTHYYVVTGWSGTPRVCEPTKHARIDWIEPERLHAAMTPPFDTGLRIFDPLGHLVVDGGIDEAEAVWKRTR